MTIGDHVEIKEHGGGAEWRWTGRMGQITDVDKYCYTVQTDDGETIRDVKEHFRLPEGAHNARI